MMKLIKPVPANTEKKKKSAFGKLNVEKKDGSNNKWSV